MPAFSGEIGQVLSVNGLTTAPSGVVTNAMEFVDHPYDLVGQGFGVLSDGDVILRFMAVRDFVIRGQGASSHRGYAVTAPTGTSAVFDIENQAATSIGQIIFAAGSNTPTYVGFNSAGFELHDGDMVIIRCTTASAIEDVSITLTGRVGSITAGGSY